MTNIKKSTFEIYQDKNGKFWLWDETRGMNLSIRSGSIEDAFTDAIEYYQERLKNAESKLYDIESKVEFFINSMNPSDSGHH